MLLKKSTWPLKLLALISEPESFDQFYKRISINILREMTNSESPVVPEQIAPWHLHFPQLVGNRGPYYSDIK